MKNKWMRAASLAMAAAMAFSMVPTKSAEAAKKNVYVVSKATDDNGGVTKYTYDSRGRLTKEVYSITTSGTAKNVKATSVTGNAKGTVTGTADKVKTEKVVTTYTYNKSGAAKDKVASSNTTSSVVIAYRYDSTDDAADTSYMAKKESASATKYTYDSDGLLVDRLTTAIAPSNYTYSNLGGKALAQSQASVDNKWNNGKSYANDKVTTNTEIVYTYNTKDLAVSTTELKVIVDYNEEYEHSSDGKTLTGVRTVVETQTAGIGDKIVTKYNKNGLPTKATTSNTGDMTATKTTSVYKVDGTLDTAKSGKLVTTASIGNSGYDEKTAKISEVTYKYDAAGNFEKMTTTGTQGVIYYTISGEQYAYDDGLKVTTKTESGEMYSLSNTKTVIEFDYKLKSGTNRMTSQTASASAKVGDNNTKISTSSRTKFTLKKISVPSARVSAIEQSQYQLTNTANVETVSAVIASQYALSNNSLLTDAMNGADAL